MAPSHFSPSVWRDGGLGTTIRWDIAPTSLGPMLVAASDKGVCRLSFGEDPAVLAQRFPGAQRVRGATLRPCWPKSSRLPKPPVKRISPGSPSMWPALRFRKPSGRRCAAFPRARRAPHAELPPPWAAQAPGARSRFGQWRQPCVAADSLPPCDPHRW